MLVSFCVIAYNEEKAIKSLFSDIKAQDYPHEKMEVILVNAMSTDKTRELMEKFAEENKDFKRVCVLDNQKKIQAAGWNVAIKASAGDIIMRIDAHTMIPSDFVSKNVECIIGGHRTEKVIEKHMLNPYFMVLIEEKCLIRLACLMKD